MGALEDGFRSELQCDDQEAALLATTARDFAARSQDLAEDSDEDLLVRLRDPRVFGAFAEPRLGDEALTHATRVALAEHAFDLLTLPRGERDVFLVEARAPRRLLAIAHFLMDADAFTVFHLMHLVYSVFLDRSLVTNVEPGVRARVLTHVLAEPGASIGLRVLYACMHLTALSREEAASEVTRALESGGAVHPVKRALATVAAAEDGGFAHARRLAEDEGLVPTDLEDPNAPSAIANVPRMPPGAAEVARRWLERGDANQDGQ